jgi:hypothetical protein
MHADTMWRMSATVPTVPPIGGSTWDTALFEHVAGHAQNEIGLLEEYTNAAEATDSKALSYLVGLLVEDEHRHHRLFAELASALKTSAEFSPEDPPVPRLDFDRVDPTAIVAMTERLLRREQNDARELKRLQRDLRDVRDTTLWSLLVELMQRDTDKHIAILRFVRRHTKPARRP